MQSGLALRLYADKGMQQVKHARALTMSVQKLDQRTKEASLISGAWRAVLAACFCCAAHLMSLAT